ncbi:MAG TPA: heme ABC exporter ATP-binding protein CcmA [Acidimicrobiales bacterium]|nr:heme ABC exporter ATP-binding protein CcmA [Acidimicrobiales bacterium]
MAPAVHLRAAVALVGRFPALAGVDLSVEPGDIVVVVGANGAGKTSLLRALAGLVPFTSGEAVVLGQDLRVDAATVRSRVGLLGHGAPLYDDLTAAENVRFAVRAAGRPAAAAEPALERLGVVGRVRRTPAARLSAGQRRRVALAALVARDPELWLLDEPHTGLDVQGRRLLAELVAEAAGAGHSVVLTSHEHDLAVPLADRVVTLAGGRVAAEAGGGRRPPLVAVPSDPGVPPGGVHVA